MRGRVLNTAIPIGDAKGVSVTASFGVAEHRVGDLCEFLLARADAALYEAKRLGRNRVIAARDPDPLDSTLRRVG